MDLGQRDNRDNKDNSDNRDIREIRDIRDMREIRDIRNIRDIRDIMDIVVLVDATGRVDRVNANLPRFETAHAANINVEQSLAILNEHLLRHYGPTNLTPSASRKTGWLQFGNQLYPITEVEVLDPIGFRHFTARVDRVNARVISVTERTKH